MSKIKVSELFYSIQGEGRYQGVPSIFLRTFGCNFTCDGFGMKRGEKSKERTKVAENIQKFKSYKDLPLVHTGCDSYASWDVNFKHLSPLMTVDEIAEKMVSLLPGGDWKQVHLVITGGEPLLGWQRSYPELLKHPLLANLKDITFETNGTQQLNLPLRDYLNNWQASGNVAREVTFSVSPKLSVSGELQTEAIKPEYVCEYASSGYTYLKFVVATEQDVKEALAAIEQYRNGGFNGPVYLMPVGGTTVSYSLNNTTVAMLAMKYGLRYSDRLQVPLFKNAWGT